MFQNNFVFSAKRRIIIHHDKEMLKNAVINNLVPEDKRAIIFSTQIDEKPSDICDDKYLTDDISRLEERIDNLEMIIKKLVEYLLKNPSESA